MITVSLRANLQILDTAYVTLALIIYWTEVHACAVQSICRDSKWHSEATFIELIFFSQLFPTRWWKGNENHGSINQSKHGLSCKVSRELRTCQTLTGVMWCDWWPEMAEMTSCHWSCGIDQSCLKVVEGPLGGMIHVAVMGEHITKSMSPCNRRSARTATRAGRKKV